MKLFPVLFAATVLTLPLVPGQAASLRPVTTLSDGHVRLADLFDDAGPEATRILGPAPTPGTRLVVEAAQLGAIARQFGVAWRPASLNDRVVLDRPGRLLAREDMSTALRRALDDAGAPQGEIELSGYAPPLIPTGARPQTLFESLDYDHASGRFTGVMTITGNDTADPQRMRVSGTLQEIIELPVLNRRLIPGSIIQPADIQIARLHANLARNPEIAKTPDQVIGLAVRRMTLAGQPLALPDLARPPTIAKGAHLRMRLAAGGLLLAADGIALEPGSTGDRIRVLNPISRAVVEADVTGPEDVNVAVGSTAQLAAARRTPEATQFAARLP